MSTKRAVSLAKDRCFSSKSSNQFYGNASKALNNNNDKFNCINLNKNQKIEDIKFVQSKNTEFSKKSQKSNGFFDYKNDSKNATLNDWMKNDTPKFNESLKTQEMKKEFKRENEAQKDCNKSTLSLHIETYENGNVTKNDTFASKTSFDFFKQQNQELMNPEIMQFKTAQKLLNLNALQIKGNLGFKTTGVMMQRHLPFNPASALKNFASKRHFSLTSPSLLNAHEYDLTDPEIQKLYKLYRPERITPHKRGIEMLKTPALNKGMAFSLFERHYFGIHGLLPPAFMTADQQAYRIMTKLRQQPDDLARYIQLDGLQDRNEKLFYKVLCENIKELMPVVYTPTVGQACQHFGFIYRNPKGVYVTINDNSISKIYQILCNWPSNDVRAIVVTDGERILGLGDLGAYGIGIPVGKLALYSALAGIQPSWCLPVLLDVGTDNQKLLNDPFYIGLRRKRVRGEEYDRLLDNFMHACTKRFGHDTLIQFEDFGNKNAYRLLDRFQESYCMFNDDIQGTASVVVAGLLACARVTGKPLSKKRFVFLGAGGAATGVAEMCVRQMQSEGLSFEAACDRIYMMDIDGLITKNRLRNLDRRHFPFAKDMADTKDLHALVKEVKPEALIGASTVKGAFTHEIIKLMAENNPRPIIFALSNPTSKAECTAEDAYKLTNGNVLFASGSPFPNVEVNGKLFKPGQGNNAYIFPGVALAVILFKVRYIDNKLFLIAARKVANSVTQKSFNVGRIYPRIDEIRELSIQIAIELANTCYADGTAKLYPEPKDKEMFIRSQIYNPEYDELINHTWEWPEQDMKHGFPVPVVRRTSTDD